MNNQYIITTLNLYTLYRLSAYQMFEWQILSWFATLYEVSQWLLFNDKSGIFGETANTLAEFDLLRDWTHNLSHSKLDSQPLHHQDGPLLDEHNTYMYMYTKQSTTRTYTQNKVPHIHIHIPGTYHLHDCPSLCKMASYSTSDNWHCFLFLCRSKAH